MSREIGPQMYQMSGKRRTGENKAHQNAPIEAGPTRQQSLREEV